MSKSCDPIKAKEKEMVEIAMKTGHIGLEA